eukprot:TRINITY_DN28443_c0_g1_i1.p1 TRINITY_DN28443_c0_g1~~TRINITY_DN28443_c0_g1_i1.p1  ORF type:complete len:321 (-),score=44.47 TRINITY_DN28443_c0_g1_i1:75-1037(-)
MANVATFNTSGTFQSNSSEIPPVHPPYISLGGLIAAVRMLASETGVASLTLNVGDVERFLPLWRRKCNLSSPLLGKAFAYADSDGNGFLTLPEFDAAVNVPNPFQSMWRTLLTAALGQMAHISDREYREQQTRLNRLQDYFLEVERQAHAARPDAVDVVAVRLQPLPESVIGGLLAPFELRSPGSPRAVHVPRPPQDEHNTLPAVKSPRKSTAAERVAYRSARLSTSVPPKSARPGGAKAPIPPVRPNRFLPPNYAELLVDLEVDIPAAFHNKLHVPKLQEFKAQQATLRLSYIDEINGRSSHGLSAGNVSWKRSLTART